MAIKDDLLRRIKGSKTPKEAWDSLITLFVKPNNAKLQMLKNELFFISQQNMIVGQYFSMVKSICDEISKLDS